MTSKLRRERDMKYTLIFNMIKLHVNNVMKMCQKYTIKINIYMRLDMLLLMFLVVEKPDCETKVALSCVKYIVRKVDWKHIGAVIKYSPFFLFIRQMEFALWERLLVYQSSCQVFPDQSCSTFLYFRILPFFRYV